jgi:DEAD/DEAH box helicase domain-containing protein
MLPSLLAEDIRKGLKNFLIVGFEASDAFFSGVIRRFTENEERWLKGPWLQLGLPFRSGIKGQKFFEHFRTEHPAHIHQERAWERICSDRQAVNTLVATGTGSGKTECFLYPLLDHCAQAVKRGERGIKALVIYPMNALANDQGRRFAKHIAETPHFSDLRVGLFVGGGHGEPGQGTVMTPSSVISDRETLRKSPPDILLTNYKMLDYLLIRPVDQPLWKNNTANTLRYIVVDEIHSFDGAQGTDLAMLLRRLKSRLKIPSEVVINIGTSATLGDSSDSSPLREYARQIFGSPFDESSVVTEARLSVSEFLVDVPVEFVFQHCDGLAERLVPEEYPTPEAAIQNWFELFFPEAPVPTLKDIKDTLWRVDLGVMLKKHLLFQNLLKQLKMNDDLAKLAQLADSFQKTLPQQSRLLAKEILNALLSLSAWSLVFLDQKISKEKTKPFLTLRIQLWLRELRRMVASLTQNSQDVELLQEVELKPGHENIYLPLVQCSECHTTGWLSRLPAAQSSLTKSVDEIYSAWFSKHAECVRLYPQEGVKSPVGEAFRQSLCTNCGILQENERSECSACNSDNMIPIWEISETRQSQNGNLTSVWHLQRCPACGVKDRLILLGARTATLGAQTVEQSWSTPFNDDKKLISFSDSVQDAAHRAGFFGARTYSGIIRRSVFQSAKYLQAENPQQNLSLSEFLQRIQVLWRDEASPLAMSREKFVAQYIGPDMQWQDDWDLLQKRGSLPGNSDLLQRVQKRFAWQTFAEVSYLNRRGRSLERLGLLVVAPNTEMLQKIADNLQETLREDLGLAEEKSKIFQWLWGFLDHLRQRGSVSHPAMRNYAETGNFFAFLRMADHRLWLQNMGSHSFHPVFLATTGHSYFDHLRSSRGKTWYETWLEKNFVLTAQNIAESAYGMAIDALEKAGILLRISGNTGVSIALNPAALQIITEPVQLLAEQGQYWLTVPQNAAEALHGMACLDGDEHYLKLRKKPTANSQRLSHANLDRVFTAEHTGLLERKPREELELRFQKLPRKPWFENLLSATPTLEMGVDIGALSSIMLCSVPPNQASFLQRIGRAGRRDGNAFTLTLADGKNNHDLYFFAEPEEMIQGEVQPPGVFLQAAEVLRRQLFAFCLDNWVAQGIPEHVFPEKTKGALDAVETNNRNKFPQVFQKFVQEHENELLAGFLALLKPDLTASVEQRLSVYLRPEGAEDHLRIRLQKVFEEMIAERALYKKRAVEIKKQINNLQKLPQDEHIKKEIEELKLERQKLLEMVREQENRDLLNTLTDAGLIPNYAFPETGVELKSVIWRRKTDRSANFKLPVYKYERPAATALSEFAPSNSFYANQRRVEVDQINMDLAEIETWRLCAECHFMQRTDVGPAGETVNCPDCGSVQWSDGAQKHNLLRFRQVIATTEDKNSRIDDRAEEREPKFYVRQMLVNFKQEAIREAWKLKGDDLPFGFEFIANADFRDINFGETNRQGDEVSVAGSLRKRPGFRICEKCGKVQDNSRSQDNEGTDKSRNHLIDCPHRNTQEQAEDVVVDLHLYRYFSSEALRILVPCTKSGVDERVVQSFIAAIQLGFKLQFGGRVDHLRFSELDTPDKDGGRRQYILIHDSVPGGTGYLHQLLSENAETILELLRKAQHHIKCCACAELPDQDGCYRCLFQYRQNKQREYVSHECALDILNELLSADVEWERVETIADIQINPHFDSVLEKMFLDALRNFSGKNGFPHIKMVQEIVNGKSGQLLDVGGQLYRIEPQKEANLDEGVAIPSKPDFLISAVNPEAEQRPVAVFCDGWEFHKNKIADDAKKRSALVHSSRYRVWSVSYQDVEQALKAETGTDLISPWLTHQRPGTDSQTLSDPQAFKWNSVAMLLKWLWHSGQNYSAELKNMQRTAAETCLKMACNPLKPNYPQEKQILKERWENLPEWVVVPENSLATYSPDGVQPEVSYWWPREFSQENYNSFSSGMVSLNDEKEITELHKDWRTWLWLFNHLQFISGMLLTSHKGLASRDYDLLPIPDDRIKKSVAKSFGIWQEMTGDIVDELAEGFEKLAVSGITAPDEIGREITDDQGQIIAEAEMVWDVPRIALLLPELSEYKELLEVENWKVVLAENDWQNEIVALLS